MQRLIIDRSICENEAERETSMTWMSDQVVILVSVKKKFK